MARRPAPRRRREPRCARWGHKKTMLPPHQLNMSCFGIRISSDPSEYPPFWLLCCSARQPWFDTRALKINFKSRESKWMPLVFSVRLLNSDMVRPPAGPRAESACCSYWWSMIGASWRLALSNLKLFMTPMTMDANPTIVGNKLSITVRNLIKPPSMFSHIVRNNAEPRNSSVTPLPVTRVTKAMYLPMYIFASDTNFRVFKKGVSNTAKVNPNTIKYDIPSQSTTLNEKNKEVPPNKAPLTMHTDAPK
mmetsp:Transcript_24804/g.70837  ORF Transcript_24804/g.70837 Transcript_24804/m.70837 type:complete len:249 (-) Transcript_24804:303-1049(-)